MKRKKKLQNQKENIIQEDQNLVKKEIKDLTDQKIQILKITGSLRLMTRILLHQENKLLNLRNQ